MSWPRGTVSATARTAADIAVIKNVAKRRRPIPAMKLVRALILSYKPTCERAFSSKGASRLAQAF